MGEQRPEQVALTHRGVVRLDELAGGDRPWAPSRREADVDLERVATDPDERVWSMSEVDIFCDLNRAEMDALAKAAPMHDYGAGEMIFTPHDAPEKLFILKKGRVRIFRVSPDGRVLTTAIVEPGTIFGEMVIVGQRMHDNFAEVMTDAVVCVMTKRDVQQLLLADARISGRICATLGQRLGTIEQRLSDAVFKSVPERIATTLLTLSEGGARTLGRGVQVRLTHEQLAALAATSRETTTKTLNEFAEAGIVGLGRGKITILDAARLRQSAG